MMARKEAKIDCRLHLQRVRRRLGAICALAQMGEGGVEALSKPAAWDDGCLRPSASGAAPREEPAQARETIEAINSPIQYVYLVEEGICSVVARMPRGRDVEVGLIGRDGMTGTAIVEGDSQTPHITFVQMEGSAYRIEVGVFHQTLHRSPGIQALLQLYGRSLGLQVSYTALRMTARRSKSDWRAGC
jgi:CRP-like cAMP-binding protein